MNHYTMLIYIYNSSAGKFRFLKWSLMNYRNAQNQLLLH